MKANPRYIYTGQSTREVSDIMQGILASEVLSPSDSFWIASPWISDIPVIDNRSNQFITIEPDWANKFVLLSDVLSKLLESGTRVTVISGNDSHNKSFFDSLNLKAEGSSDLRISIRSHLHAKGMVSDNFFLGGSMNFTFNGITLNQELLTFVTNPEDVAFNKINFKTKWGDVIK